MTLPLPIPDIHDSDEKWNAYAERLNHDELQELEAYINTLCTINEDVIHDLKHQIVDSKKNNVLSVINMDDELIHRILDMVGEKASKK